jgi:hypothetical protein
MEAASTARTVCGVIVVVAIPRRNYSKTYEKVYPFSLTPKERKSEDGLLDIICHDKT